MKQKNFKEFLKEYENCEITDEAAAEIEAAATRAIENFGTPEVIFIEDPRTEKLVRIDVKNPTKEAMDLISFIIETMDKRSGAV